MLAIGKGGIWLEALGVCFVVYGDSAVFYDHAVSRQADDALYELFNVGLAILCQVRLSKDNDIATIWNVRVPSNPRPSAGDFPYDKPVIVLQRIFHTWPVDLVRLEHECDQRQCQNYRRDKNEYNRQYVFDSR